jgi:hypothetical protein
MIATKSKDYIHISSGETWFTIYTNNPDQLMPSYFRNFTHEFILSNLSGIISKAEIEYVRSSLLGESVTVTQKDYRELIVSSVDDIKNIQIINSNGIELFEQSYPGDTKQSQIDASNYHAGIYFAKVHLSNGKVETKKFLKF